jgi:hypothetical protein
MRNCIQERVIVRAFSENSRHSQIAVPTLRTIDLLGITTKRSDSAADL